MSTDWVIVSKFQLTPDWVLSPTLDGDYFRLKHTVTGTPPDWVIGEVGQVYLDGTDKTLYQPKQIYPKPEYEVWQLSAPFDHSSRRIGFRNLTRKKANYIWEIELSMSLWNPTKLGAATTVSTPKAITLDTTSSKVLMPANPLRFGVIINNTALADLYVNYGAPASATNYVAILNPGGYHEVPYGYTGEIDGIIVAKTNVSGTVTAIEFT